mmetsp:Transcript_58212/g.126424  ORF Transcript_58212/g.126424 Transcript_58212/m.126424 type:complete len:201 (-) Transcript_58212:504-1106(-)
MLRLKVFQAPRGYVVHCATGWCEGEIDASRSPLTKLPDASIRALETLRKRAILISANFLRISTHLVTAWAARRSVCRGASCATFTLQRRARAPALSMRPKRRTRAAGLVCSHSGLARSYIGLAHSCAHRDCLEVCSCATPPGAVAHEHTAASSRIPRSPHPPGPSGGSIGRRNDREGGTAEAAHAQAHAHGSTRAHDSAR